MEAGCRVRLRTRCRWVDLGVARSLRRRRSSRRCAHISSLAAAVDVDDVAEALATADGAMRSHHAAAAGELAGHMRAASRATRRRKALVQRKERRPLSSKQPRGGRRCDFLIRDIFSRQSGGYRCFCVGTGVPGGGLASGPVGSSPVARGRKPPSASDGLASLMRTHGFGGELGAGRRDHDSKSDSRARRCARRPSRARRPRP